jgi:drug/metabolite transporter (DMT)-like permease
MVVVIGLGSGAIGHTLYNASLRRAHPTLVNLISTQEVSGSILLAYLLLGETPAGTTLAGVAVSLLGVLLVMLL